MGIYSSRTRNDPVPAQATRCEPAQTTDLSKPEQCYDPLDQTLTFVDGEDVLDFEYVGYRSQRAAMSCGHAVTPMSLTKYCSWLLREGRHMFVCPIDGCGVEWGFAEVCKMGLLTQEEKEDFKEKLSTCRAQEFVDTKSCPGCKSPLVREDASNLRIRCMACSDRGTSSDFCWQCLRKWRGPSPRSDRCDNHDCVNEDLEILKNCKEIHLDALKDGIVCPSVRACPTCGLMQVHDTHNCSGIICPRCHIKFCFVCLRPATACLLDYKSCWSRIAPRQTSIPVWHRK